jgi:hypothetical protein
VSTLLSTILSNHAVHYTVYHIAHHIAHHIVHALLYHLRIITTMAVWIRSPQIRLQRLSARLVIDYACTESNHIVFNRQPNKRNEQLLTQDE